MARFFVVYNSARLSYKRCLWIFPIYVYILLLIIILILLTLMYRKGVREGRNSIRSRIGMQYQFEDNKISL